MSVTTKYNHFIENKLYSNIQYTSHRGYSTINIYSLNKLCRYEKRIKINENNKNNILILMQNPSNDMSKYCIINNIIYNITSDINHNIKTITIINLYSFIIVNITRQTNKKYFYTNNEKYNEKYIKKLLISNKFHEIYIGTGQHLLSCGFSKEFKQKYLRILKYIDKFKIRKYKCFGQFVYKNKIPRYPKFLYKNKIRKIKKKELYHSIKNLNNNF